jgi:N-glycosylase/DNA lyase
LDFTIGLEGPFSLDYTLESGQVFRWERRGEWWYGVVSAGVLKLKQEGDSLKCVSSNDLLDSGFVRGYFRLDDDLEGVLASIAKDPPITNAVQKFYGMRLMRQERWECLASFVLATNANIPRIKKMVSALCSRYGAALEFEGSRYFAFPRPEALAAAPTKDLRACGLGYRAPFLKRVARSVEDGRVDFTALVGLEYDGARKELLRELFGEKVLLGVGPKVADCVLLYSCGKDEAFPVDVWIARELAKSYPKIFGKTLRRRLAADGKVHLGLADYDRISKTVRAHFGRFAGYAQQYLYMAARSSGD